MKIEERFGCTTEALTGRELPVDRAEHRLHRLFDDRLHRPAGTCGVACVHRFGRVSVHADGGGLGCGRHEPVPGAARKHLGHNGGERAVPRRAAPPRA
jgi:hypothetical protein